MSDAMTAERPDPPIGPQARRMPASGGSDPAAPLRFERRFTASDLETRITLAEVCARLAAAGLDEDDIGTVELVLAEVLNNIAEHAYRYEGGPVALNLDLPGDAVVCSLVDQGQPMPLGQVPEPGLPAIAPPDILPEGGFGWHIVRCLVSDLSYEHGPDGNRLRLRVPVAGGM
jgi:serine/threonine-protein kinase RsbW